jgi:DUF1680 family protein
MAYLLWRGIPPKGMWVVPRAYQGSELKGAIDFSRKAFTLVQDSDDVVLWRDVENDLAYYLSLTGRIETIDEAIRMIDNAIRAFEEEFSEDAPGAYFDTRGFAYLKKFDHTSDKRWLDLASRDIHRGYGIDRGNTTRMDHLDECMARVIEIGAISPQPPAR